MRYAIAAVSTLEPLGSGADLAMAYSNVSHLRMIGGATEEALTWGRRAVDEAHAAGDREVESHALNNMGTALLHRGDMVEGRASLDQSLDIALADGLEEHAARAWMNIGALQFAKRMLADSEHTFRTGIKYCNDRDLDSSWLHMRAWLAGVLLERGATDAAVSLAEQVLRHPQLSLLSRISALLPTNLVAVRRGEEAGAGRLAELARGSADPLRLLPVALLQAEARWTAGRIADVVPLTDEVWAACAADWEPWILAGWPGGAPWAERSTKSRSNYLSRSR